MKIGGIEPISLSDFPGKVATVIFTQGCNFRCGFCANGRLIPTVTSPGAEITEEEACRAVREREGFIDGVVLSGGEPTIQPDLGCFLARLKSCGRPIKLDTNGSRPRVLRSLLRQGLIDYIAMDVKAPFDRYDELTRVPSPVAKLKESIAMIAGSGLPHEFRTTVVTSLLSSHDIEAIRRIIPPGSFHRLQTFDPTNALDPTLRARAIDRTSPGAKPHGTSVL